jgi:coproporphyrinogen III oxidase
VCNKELICAEFKALQDHICAALEALDGGQKFHEDNWKREEGGGGRTRILSHGNLIEKGGVNFSEVHGPVSDLMRKQLNLDGDEFYATGVSIVLHPHNPHVPIIHMNVRYFELNTGVYWFGGGIDLTPHYVVPEYATKFHRGLKSVCDKYNNSFYPKFKQWADDYFFIPHRNETRGIGGIFYDHLKADNKISKEQLLRFSLDLGRLFPLVYKEQADAFRDLPFSNEEINWRNYRRGRYVEFNLVYDRGTTFGLKTNGRTESILMSLPENASWIYNRAHDEKEIETINALRKNIDWISL